MWEVLSGIKQKTGWAGRRKSSEMTEGRFWLRSVIIESLKVPEGGRKLPKLPVGGGSFADWMSVSQRGRVL